MVSKNGAHPQSVDTVEHADPTGVFGRVGRTLSLGGQPVTIRMLRNREVKAQQPLLDAMTYSGDGSAGQQFYDGMMGSKDWAPVTAWLAAWTEPAVTPEQLENATGDETIAVIDAIFEQSGLAWLRRALGNRAARLLTAPMPPQSSAPGGTESDSTPSTS